MWETKSVSKGIYLQKKEVHTFRDARVNLSEIIDTNEGYFGRECCCASPAPTLIFLPPAVSRKPFLTKDLADEGVVAWMPFRLFWVKDPKGAWGLPLLAQLLMSCICLNI